jgi:hypothetical protein
MNNEYNLTPNEAIKLLKFGEIVYDKYGAIYRANGYIKIMRNRELFGTGTEEFLEKSKKLHLTFRHVGEETPKGPDYNKVMIEKLISVAESRMVSHSQSLKKALEDTRMIKEILFDISEFISGLDQEDIDGVEEIIERIKKLKFSQ